MALKQDPLILWLQREGIFYPDTAEQALINPYYLWEFLEKQKDQSLMATSGWWLVQLIQWSSQAVKYTPLSVFVHMAYVEIHTFKSSLCNLSSGKSRRWDERREKQRMRCGGREAVERLTDHKAGWLDYRATDNIQHSHRKQVCMQTDEVCKRLEVTNRSIFCYNTAPTSDSHWTVQRELITITTGYCAVVWMLLWIIFSPSFLISL